MTIGLTAGAAALIQYFSSVSDGEDTARAALDEHLSQLQSVTAMWGDAVPALQAYTESLRRTRDQADLMGATKTAVDDQWKVAREEVDALKDELADLVSQLNAAGESTEIVAALSSAFKGVSSSVLESSENAEAMRKVNEALSQAVSSSGIPAIETFGASFKSLADTISGAARQANKFRDEAIQALVSGKSLGDFKPLQPLFSEGGRILSGEDFIPRIVPTPDARPLDLARDPAKTASQILNGDGRFTAIPTPSARPNYFEMEDQSAKLLAGYRERLTFARAELDLIGQSDAARRAALATLQAEQALRQANLPLTGSAADKYREEAKALTEVNAEIRRQGEAWDKLRDTGSGAIDSLVDGLTKGDLGSGLKAAADDIVKMLTEIGIKNPLKNGLLGTDLPTGADLGSIFARLAGKGDPLSGLASSVGAMSVTAGTVSINGGLVGAGASDLTRLLSPANTNKAGAPFDTLLSGGTGSPLSFVGNYRKGVDPRLTDILNSAAQQFPGFKVDAISGLRPGDPRFHGKGLATDIQLTDLISGKRLGNYQDAASFGTYERFAQTARQIQMQRYPELADKFRWGGYFSGAKGKYGALDTMHFDLGGAGMGGGSWERGLTSAQAALWPGIKSQGMAATKALEGLTRTTTAAASGLDVFGGGLGKLGSVLSNAGAGGSGSGGGFLSSLLGGFGRIFGGVSPTSSLWRPNTTLGSVLVNGFDRGGYTGRVVFTRLLASLTAAK